MTNNLNQYTERRGSLSRLAADAKITLSALCEYRNGTKRPNYKTACRIARALGATVEAVFPRASELQGAPLAPISFPRPIGEANDI